MTNSGRSMRKSRLEDDSIIKVLLKREIAATRQFCSRKQTYIKSNVRTGFTSNLSQDPLCYQLSHLWASLLTFSPFLNYSDDVTGCLISHGLKPLRSIFLMNHLSFPHQREPTSRFCLSWKPSYNLFLSQYYQINNHLPCLFYRDLIA